MARWSPGRNGPNGLLHIQPLKRGAAPTVLEDDLDADAWEPLNSIPLALVNLFAMLMALEA